MQRLIIHLMLALLVAFLLGFIVACSTHQRDTIIQILDEILEQQPSQNQLQEKQSEEQLDCYHLYQKQDKSENTTECSNVWMQKTIEDHYISNQKPKAAQSLKNQIGSTSHASKSLN